MLSYICWYEEDDQSRDSSESQDEENDALSTDSDLNEEGKEVVTSTDF